MDFLSKFVLIDLMNYFRKIIKRQVLYWLVAIQAGIAVFMGLPALWLVIALISATTWDMRRLLLDLPFAVCMLSPFAVLGLHLLMIKPRLRRRARITLPLLSAIACSPILFFPMIYLWSLSETIIIGQVRWLSYFWLGGSADNYDMDVARRSVLVLIVFLIGLATARFFASPRPSRMLFVFISFSNILMEFVQFYALTHQPNLGPPN